jgi:hypothetical protein
VAQNSRDHDTRYGMLDRGTKVNTTGICGGGGAAGEKRDPSIK